MKIFEYAVIYVPKENANASKKEEDKASILVAPTTVLAADISAVQILAARAIPEKYLDKLACVEVAVRPF